MLYVNSKATLREAPLSKPCACHIWGMNGQHLHTGEVQGDTTAHNSEACTDNWDQDVEHSEERRT